jgi:mannobiose 2-epimerase
MEALGSAQIGTREYWVGQVTHIVDFFARVSVDREDGGYYTSIDYSGKIIDPHHKFLMPTSRQIYAYSVAYMLTGVRRYLDLATHGVQFVLGPGPYDRSGLNGHFRCTAEKDVYWVEQVDKSGRLSDDEREEPVLLINQQTYALTGLIAYYEATRDVSTSGVERHAILDIIRRGYTFITRRFRDEVHGGFFDRYDVARQAPVATKGYNSTVYPATSAFFDLTRIADPAWRLEILGEIRQLANLFVKHFPDPTTGFIKENFTQDWTPEWRGWQLKEVRRQVQELAEEAGPDEEKSGTFTASIGIAGHNTQGALFLLRARTLLQKEDLLTAEEAAGWYATARQLVDNMLERAYDSQFGGWHDAFVRETGQKMWHTNKDWWQQEQGLLATGLLALSETGDGGERYRRPTLQTLAFWDSAFIDRDLGGDRKKVSREGAPLPQEFKGDVGKSSYHSVEMARLAIELGLPRLVEQAEVP